MANQVIDNFKTKIGVPTQEETTEIRFEKSMQQAIWERIIDEIGCGLFQNGFFYFFGKELNKFESILKYWSFLLEEKINYSIIGFNKMGFIILAENLENNGMASQITIIDPLNVRLYKNTQIKLLNFIGRWLPDGLIPGLNNNRLYEAVIKEIDENLELEEIIAIKKPFSLGGELKAENFSIENINEYFKTTGKIYASYKK